MKCPFCDREMELGYIQCRDGVTWTPKEQLVAALSFLGKIVYRLRMVRQTTQELYMLTGVVTVRK